MPLYFALVFFPPTDIEPKSNGSAPLTGNANKPLWSRSDNNFRFNFLPDNLPSPREETSLPSDSPETAPSRISFTGQGSTFAFNFQIPSSTPVEHMDTAETPQASSLGGSQEFQGEKPSESQDAVAPEASVQSKAKKKKKSGKKKPSDETVPEQEPGGAEGNQGVEDAELVSVWGFPLNLSR